MSFALLFLSISAIFSPQNNCVSSSAPMAFSGETIDRINQDLANLRSKPLITRLTYWSGRFMGTPYGLDPSGEGYGRDPDPLFNVCEVDCETFVEQVLALSFSSSLPHVWRWLEKMRYRQGERSYSNRYYTMALQWIPANIKLGYLVPAHKKMGVPTALMKKMIDPDYRWARVFRKRLKELGKHAPRGEAKLRYIPLETLRKEFTRIPVPSMGLVVGAKQIKNPFLITHMGFILKNEKGQHIWRHASFSANRRKVEDRLLSNYLKALRTYFTRYRRRHVKGLIIYSIVDPRSSGDDSP